MPDTIPETSPDTAEAMQRIAARLQLSSVDKPGAAARRVLYTVGATLIAATVWAGFAESDVCAEASGELVPRIKVQVVRPSVDGTLDKYLVAEGQNVKPGDALLVLNTVRAEASLNEQKQQLSIFQTQFADHEKAKNALEKIIANPRTLSKEGVTLAETAHIVGETFVSRKALDQALYDASRPAQSAGSSQTPEFAGLLLRKQGLLAGRLSKEEAFKHKVTGQEAQRKEMQSRVRLLQAEIENASKELQELQESLKYAKSEMAIYEKAQKLGVASGVKFLDAENYAHQREYSVLQSKAKLQDLQHQLESAQLDLDLNKAASNADNADMMAGIKNDESSIVSVPVSTSAKNLETRITAFEVASNQARAQLSKEISKLHALEREISETTGSIKFLEMQLEERTIKAPIAGTVTDLTHMAPGAMVLRGQELMSLVPADKILIVRGHVKAADIGFVAVGQDVRLRIMAFPCEDFGIINGKVEWVGNYPEELKENNKVESTYRVHILPDRTWIGSSQHRINLRVGLSVQADIVVHKRTLLTLLLEPFFKNEL